MGVRDLVEIMLFILAVIALAAVFFWSCLVISESQKKSDTCDAACAPYRAITPFVGGEEICLCDMGQGAWKKTDIKTEE